MIEKPYSKQRWRFFDLGLFIHVAQRVAEDVGIVEYFSPYEEAFTGPHKSRLGEGVPGITRIPSFFENKDEVDRFIFTDVGFGDIVDDLRAQGKAVYGVGLQGQKIERDRFHLIKTLDERGLYCAPWKKIKGVSNLVAHLKESPGVWVKLNNDSRKIKETFFVKDYKSAANTLYKLAYDLDCFAETQLFLVEPPIFPGDKGVEMGDDWNFAGDYLPIGLYGAEMKGDSYGGRFMPYDELPVPARVVTEAMRPVFRKGGVQSARSSEIRFGKINGKVVGSFRDACQRFGCPPSGVLTRGYKNITKIMGEMAVMRMVKPEPVAEYCAEIIVGGSSVNDEAVEVFVDEKDMNRVLLRQYCKIKDQIFRVPHKDGTLVCECVGFGKTLEEAQQQARESVELVNFEGKTWQTDTFEEMDEKLDLADKMGVGLESGKK
jgi:hypothetical protein